MNETIRSRREARAWQKRFELGAPRIGDMAPDFELFDIHGELPVRLSSFRGHKPVALIFGSFT
jgi:hypothetical protein